MTPRFGGLTQTLSIVFLLTGGGACWAGIDAGSPGDRMILLGLAVMFLAVGACLWMGYQWAWWAGLGVSAVTVVGTLVAGLPIGGVVVWAGALVLFFVSAMQGRADRSPGRRSS